MLSRETWYGGHDLTQLLYPHLYGHVQEVPVIQAGFHSAILITAAPDIRMWRTHDEELVEVALGQKLKQHADGLLLGHHTQEAHNVWVLELGQHGSLL